MSALGQNLNLISVRADAHRCGIVEFSRVKGDEPCDSVLVAFFKEVSRSLKVSQSLLCGPIETAVILLLSAGQAGMRLPLRGMLKQPHGSAGRWKKGVGIAKQSMLFKRIAYHGVTHVVLVIWHGSTDSC